MSEETIESIKFKIGADTSTGALAVIAKVAADNTFSGTTNVFSGTDTTFTGLRTYASEAAAVTASTMSAGMLYSTSTGEVRIKL